MPVHRQIHHGQPVPGDAGALQQAEKQHTGDAVHLHRNPPAHQLFDAADLRPGHQHIGARGHIGDRHHIQLGSPGVHPNGFVQGQRGAIQGPRG